MSVELLVSGRGVTKVWADGGGLAPIDFDLATGSLTALRGRSGSGKTTLLSILAGWIQPSGGRIERHPDASAATWSGTAIVPQALGLVSELPVYDNVALPVRLGRLAGQAFEIDVVIAALDLDEHTSRLPNELSMGQRQRVAIARALVLRPALVLIDEPTSHQDGAHADAVMGLIRSVTESGSTALVATHDPAVISVADAVLDLGS